MANPVRDQLWPLFGPIYERLRSSADWESLDDEQRAARLRDAVQAEDRKYGRPIGFAEVFDFVGVIKALGLPDV